MIRADRRGSRSGCCWPRCRLGVPRRRDGWAADWALANSSREGSLSDQPGRSEQLLPLQPALRIARSFLRGYPPPHSHLLPPPFFHGQSEKETASQDEQAQAPQAFEGPPPQEAHVAEVARRRRPGAPSFEPTALPRWVFCFRAAAPWEGVSTYSQEIEKRT